MRLAILSAIVAAGLGVGAEKWVAPLAPTPVSPPRTDIHPVDAFLGAVKPPATDAAFARRAYLDLWGLLPTPEQLAAFERDRAADKRSGLIDSLLANNDNYSEHWISFWNDLLRNDEGVVYHGERKSITPWLRKALRENLPYNQFVSKLLNPSQPGDPEGFLTGVNWRGTVSASELPPVQAAQNSAQIFLGINLKCNSCHDSFISKWKLADAYGLASFFSEGPLELVRCDVKQGKTAQTKFLFPELGEVPQGLSLADRRALAAKLFTASENGRLARTYVNRIWTLLMGSGIVPNVDDMAAKPSNPELLDWLANDLASHNFDSKHLLKTIMSSSAYQAAKVEPRRLSAEQFLDSIAELTGEWRVLEDRSTKSGAYAREWRFKSSSLSRSLGRPIRDQVTTVRLTQPTTLQALELVNGATLASLLDRGSRRMLGQLPDAPKSLFDSGRMSGTKNQPVVDIDITGREELHLLMVDVDSYDPSKALGGFMDAELSGANGVARQVPEAAALTLPADVKLDLRSKSFTRFHAKVAIDPAATNSDINATVRFFVFGEKPDLTRLLTVSGPRPVESALPSASSQKDLITRIYRFALSRDPAPKEIAVAADILGKQTTPDSLQDFLWTVVMSPEFQYIR